MTESNWVRLRSAESLDCDRCWSVVELYQIPRLIMLTRGGKNALAIKNNRQELSDWVELATQDDLVKKKCRRRGPVNSICFSKEGNATLASQGCAQRDPFCPLDQPYDRSAPTKQNLLCHGSSAIETILNHPDFWIDQPKPLFESVEVETTSTTSTTSSSLQAGEDEDVTPTYFPVSSLEATEKIDSPTLSRKKRQQNSTEPYLSAPQHPPKPQINLSLPAKSARDPVSESPSPNAYRGKTQKWWFFLWRFLTMLSPARVVTCWSSTGPARWVSTTVGRPYKGPCTDSSPTYRSEQSWASSPLESPQTLTSHQPSSRTPTVRASTDASQEKSWKMRTTRASTVPSMHRLLPYRWEFFRVNLHFFKKAFVGMKDGHFFSCRTSWVRLKPEVCCSSPDRPIASLTSKLSCRPLKKFQCKFFPSSSPPLLIQIFSRSRSTARPTRCRRARLRFPRRISSLKSCWISSENLRECESRKFTKQGKRFFHLIALLEM